jgi:hypothetical protein
MEREQTTIRLPVELKEELQREADRNVGKQSTRAIKAEVKEIRNDIKRINTTNPVGLGKERIGGEYNRFHEFRSSKM